MTGTTYPTSTNTVYDPATGMYVAPGSSTSNLIQNLGTTTSPTTAVNIAAQGQPSSFTVTPDTSNTGSGDTSSNGMTADDIKSIVESLMPKQVPPNYPAGVFDVTDPNTFINKAKIKLAPYYQQLLTESQGDLHLAIQNLEQDYQIGARKANEDFASSMKSLGLTINQEQNSLKDTLNKRGIALTQDPNANTTSYAGAGQPQYELGQLNQDEQLRSEAVQRTQQRALETAGVNRVRGEETATQQQRQTAENIQSQEEAQAVARGGVYQQADLAQKQADIQKAQNAAQYGTTSSTSNVDPNNPDSIIAAFPGYKTMDRNAVVGDYAATKGVGKA